MKRLKLGILLILFLIPTITFGKDLRYISFPTGSFGQDTLKNIGTNKIPTDTLLINFADYVNYGLFDTFLIYIRTDSVTGLYGGTSFDSTQMSPFSVQIQPVLRYPFRAFSYTTTLILDTVVSIQPTIVEDSVWAVGKLYAYPVHIQFPQYYIWFKHNWADTSKANAQARTVYKGWIGLRKKD